MLLARSPKYPGLYDQESGVRFRSGRAEVTEEQARLLAKRRFTDRVLIEDIPAKKWVQQQDSTNDEPTPTTATPADEKPGTSRKAT